MANNVSVDFTSNICAVDPLGAGLVVSEFGGNPVPIVGNGAWQASIAALAPGHIRCSVAYYGGNPGYGAGGSSRTPGTATALINTIKSMGAIPLVSFNGDTADNNFVPADGGSLVHYFNDGGGQHGGPVKYWSIGNEAGNGAPYTSGSGTGSASATLTAMRAADSTINVGAPAAAFWDTAFLNWAAANLPTIGTLSYHAYDGNDAPGSDPPGGGFPNDSQLFQHIHTDMPAMKAGILYGIEEMNWHSSYSGLTQFTDWHNTCFLADNFGQALSGGGHATVYSDSNGALGLLNDGGGQGQIGANGTPQAAYWGLGIWTGMNGQFKRWGAHMVSATTTFGQGVVTVFASDSGKIVIVNKDSATAHALTIGLTLPGGATSGTYNVWATNQGSPTTAIAKVVNGAAFSGGVISYTIPAGTAVSIDVTSGGASGVTLTNSFEGGTNGTTVTTANSGGASGNAFDATNITSGSVLAFSSTQKAHGSLSLATSTPVGSGSASVQWSAQLGVQTLLYGRVYLYLPSAPAVDDSIIAFDGGGSFAGGVMVTASGLLSTQNAAFGITLGPSLPTGQWLRIEWRAACGSAGSASLAVNYYLGDSITSAGAITDTAGAYGVAGSIDTVTFGWNSSHPSQPTIYWDDIGLSSIGFLGPSVGTQVRSAALSGTGTLTAGGVATGAGLLSNSFDGGTNGTTITTGNSGGSSGNAFSAVSIVSGGVVAFSSTQVAHGALAGKFSTGVTSGVAVTEWTSGVVGTQPALYGRLYVYLTANPTSDDNIVEFLGGSAAFGGGIMIASSGQLRIQNASFGEVGGGPTMPLNQWFRLEWEIVSGTGGAASATLNYYSSADSGTITSTLTDTTGAYGSGGSINEVHFGWTGGHASQATMYLDAIGLSTTGFLGPVLSLVTSSAALSGTGTLTAGALASPAVVLTGIGTLTATRAVSAHRTLALSGTGTLGVSGTFPAAAAMSGTGTLGIAQVTPKVQTLQDAFLSDDLADLWANSGGTLSVSGGRCSLNVDSGFNSFLQSTISYDLTSSFVFGMFTPYTGAASAQFGLVMSTDGSPSNAAVIQYTHGSMQASLTQGGSGVFSPAVTYDATAHAWWRIREEAGVLYFDTAPDGVTWTLLWSSTYTLDFSDAYALVFSGLDSGSDPTGLGYVTDINYLPGAGSFPGTFPGIVGLLPASMARAPERPVLESSEEPLSAGGGTLQLGMLGGTLANGYQGGPSGAAKVAPSAAGNSWEIYVRSGTDYTTLLAQIPNSMLTSFQFVRMLDDIGSGTVVLDMDDPWWQTVTLPGGLPTETLLDEECLWQVYKDGVARFEFLGETVTEQLADPSEQRLATVTGPGTIAVLKWAMAAPLGFPDIVLKLDGVLDSFDEVDEAGHGVIDTNIWTTVSPSSHIYTTPIGTLFNYPEGAGYALSSLYPSGSLTIVGSPETTFLGASPYDATDTLISAQVTPLGVTANQADSLTPAKYGAGMNGSELTQFYIQSNKDQSFYALFGLSASAFYAQIHDRSGTYTKILPAYNPSNHAYWMITEQGGSGGGSGTFYWWTSPDGENWTKQWTALHHWDATNCSFFVTASYSVDSKVSMQLTNLNSNVTTPSYQGEIYLGAPMMGIWLDQFNKAQARGTIPFVTSRLTGIADSYGRPWTDVQNVQTVNGTDLYSFLQSAASVVNADYVMDPGFQLRVGQPATGQVSLGVDRAAFLIFRDGHDSISRQRVRARDQIVTVIGGENADGHEISATSPAFATQWGKREGWFQTSVQVDPVSMAYATAASLAQNETEILSWTLTITPNVPGKTVFDDFDVGDWVGLERPDFSAIDDIRVVGIAVQVDSSGNETHELTVNSYIQWLAEQLTYLANKLGGQFVNTLGATPVAPSKYGTGQVPTYYTPAATLAGLADVAGGSGTSTKSSAPLVYNAATGQYQQAGTTDPVSGQTVPVVVSVPGQGSVVTGANTITVYDPGGTVRVITGQQGDGTITSVDFNGAAPLTPDNPGVGGAIGGVAVSWDGLLTGTAPLSDFQYVQVHLGLSAVFVPSALTLMGTLHTAGTLAVNNLAAGTAYWAKLVAVNTSGNASAPTPGVSGTAEGVSATDLTGQLPASLLGNSAGSWALNPNPFFNAGDTSGWTAAGATLTATATVPGLAPGNAPWVAVLTSTVAGGDMDGSGAPFPVTAGQPYAMTAWVYNTGAVATSVQIGFNWTGGTQTFSVPPGVWAPLTTVQTAPPGTVAAYQIVQLVSSGVTVNVSAAVAAGQINGGLIAASTVTAQQIAAGIILAGVVNGTLIEGAQFVSFGTSGEVLVYSGTPAVGNLVGSWSAATGNDAAISGGAGNNYPAGLMIGTPGSSQVLLNPQANQPFNLTTAIAGVLTAMAQFVSGDSAEQFPGVVGSVNLGSGTTAKQTLVAMSPMASGTGAAMLLESQNDAGSDTPVVTFGTVSSPDASTLVFTPMMALYPYAMIIYSGAATQVVVTKTSGTGTIPIPGGVTVGKGEAWGGTGGSAGGGTGDVADPGGGAGGGEYSCEPALPLTGGGTASYAVGTGGTAGTGANGGAGTSSTLTGNGVTVTAHPGGAGLLGIGATGGLAGSGSTNTVHFPGGAGGNTNGASGASGGSGGGGSGGTASAGRAGSSTSAGTGLSGASGALAVGGGGSGGSGGAGFPSAAQPGGHGSPGLPGVAPGGGPGGGGNGGNGHAGTAGQVRLTYLTGTPSVGFAVNYGTSFTDQYGNTIPAGTNLSTDVNGALVVGTNVELQPPGFTPGTPGTGIKLYASNPATSVTAKNLRGFTGQLPLTQTNIGSNIANTTGDLPITAAWSIPANDAQAGTIYRVSSNGTGTWGTAVTLAVLGNLDGTNITGGGAVGRIAGAFLANATTFNWSAVYEVVVITTGGGGTIRSQLTFSITAQATAVTPGTAADNTMTVVTGPQTGTTAFDTTAAHTLGIGAAWGATTGTPSIGSAWSHLERLGP